MLRLLLIKAEHHGLETLGHLVNKYIYNKFIGHFPSYSGTRHVNEPKDPAFKLVFLMHSTLA
jgi:hypothetical protein